jgi:hypothetical protein
MPPPARPGNHQPPHDLQPHKHTPPHGAPGHAQRSSSGGSSSGGGGGRAHHTQQRDRGWGSSVRGRGAARGAIASSSSSSSSVRGLSAAPRMPSGPEGSRLLLQAGFDHWGDSAQHSLVRVRRVVYVRSAPGGLQHKAYHAVACAHNTRPRLLTLQTHPGRLVDRPRRQPAVGGRLVGGHRPVCHWRPHAAMRAWSVGVAAWQWQPQCARVSSSSPPVSRA